MRKPAGYSSKCSDCLYWNISERLEMIGNKVRGLGEIVLRVDDMESMKNFYRNIIGFELMHESDDFTFFNVCWTLFSNGVSAASAVREEEVMQSAIVTSRK